MSCTSASAALKTAAGCRSDRVLSALRNHVHYTMNYVFEGCGPGDRRVGVLVRCLRVDLGQIRGVPTVSVRQQLPLVACH